MPASMSGPRRSRSRWRTPASAWPMRSRTASVLASVEPLRRNARLASASPASSRRDIKPARAAARANSKAEEPAIRVRSRSKNAAERCCDSTLACDVDDDRVALPSARTDGRAALASAAAAQLEHERAQDARARRAERVAQRHGAAVDVDLVLVDAEHPDRAQGDRGKGLVDLPQVDVVDAQTRLIQRLLRGRGRRAREVGKVVGDLSLRE